MSCFYLKNRICLGPKPAPPPPPSNPSAPRPQVGGTQETSIASGRTHTDKYFTRAERILFNLLLKEQCYDSVRSALNG